MLTPIHRNSQLTRHRSCDQGLPPFPKKIDLSPHGLACPHIARNSNGEFLGDDLRLVAGRHAYEKVSDLLEVESYPVSPGPA